MSEIVYHIPRACFHYSQSQINTLSLYPKIIVPVGHTAAVVQFPGPLDNSMTTGTKKLHTSKIVLQTILK